MMTDSIDIASDVVRGHFVSGTGCVDLPFEIISDVLLRLPIEDLVRCRSVCKKAYNLTTEYGFTTLQIRRALYQPYPFILVSEEPCFSSVCRNSLFFMDKDKCKEIPMKKLKRKDGYEIKASCNGLLLVASSSMSELAVSIYNPIIGECIKLPEQEPKCFKTRSYTVLYGFGFDRMNKKYKVVRVYRPYYSYTDYTEDCVTEDPVTTGEIITEGECSWRKLKFPYQVQFTYGSTIVYLDEAFHWAIDRKDETSGLELVLSLDIVTEKFHTIPLPHLELPVSAVLINFAGFLAFVKSQTLDSSSPIWQIVGSGTSAKRIREYVCEYVTKANGSKYYCTVLTMLSNGSILYKATEHLEFREIGNGIKPSDHLGQFFPEKKQSFILQIEGVPRDFSTIPYIPTFVSPCSIYYPPKPSVSVELILPKAKTVRKVMEEN